MVLPYFHHDLAAVDRHVLPDAEDTGVRLVECRIFPLSMRVNGFEIACPIHGISNDSRVVAADCNHPGQTKGIAALETGKTNDLGGRLG